MSSASMSLLDVLRARTGDRHRQLDSSAFTRSLANGTLAPEGYRAMLNATFIIRDALERTLEAHTSPVITSVWSSAFRRAPLLENDLRHLERAGGLEFPRAIEAASAVAGWCRRRADVDPISLLGWLYVMEGSMKGAPVVCRLARRAFDFHSDDGLTYLLSADGTASDTWTEFSGRMNALTLNDDERARVAAAAVELFDGLIAIFQALQPAADSLNPEAGQHPIPFDPREVAASKRAGDACWRKFPYLDRRYSERGRRFTTSDSAWLVTLAELDQETVNQQVLWLGRVLGARGLPRIILEEQLHMLHDELTQAVPHGIEMYARLLGASRMLRGRRVAGLAGEQFDAIAARFEARTEPERNRLPHVGVLIVSAVTDEHDGVPSAVESLTGWLQDPVRFSEGWISAVEETLSETRALMPTYNAQSDARKPW